MSHADANLLLVVTLAAVLASLLARLLVWRYRVTMKALMQMPVPAQAAAPPGMADTALPPVAHAAPQAPQAVTLADNRRAAWRVSVLLLVLTALVALASAVLTLWLPSTGAALTPRRALVLAVAQTWPAIPALALLWRWPALRTLLAFALWVLVAAVTVALNSDAPQPLRRGLVYVVADSSFALVWAALLTGGAATRAIAPWLVLPLAVMLAAPILGLEVLERGTDADAGWLRSVAGALGAWPTLGLFVGVPALVLLWPARRIGAGLAAAYQRGWLSELTMLFAVLTALALLQRVITGLGSSQGQSLVLLLPLVLVPLGMLAARSRARAPGRPPALLVLRVFQRDRAVSALFDLVIERWRLTGHTVLIAGTDLLERTIDGDDVWAFIGGTLRSRFVLAPADLAPRIAELGLGRDLDGRYRVNEVYCHDGTWRLALGALVARADVVLMDLRGFQRRNRGCRHELAVLARAPDLALVVVLTDKDTDLADAQQAACGAPCGRFEWVDTTSLGRTLARQVLARLFVAG